MSGIYRDGVLFEQQTPVTVVEQSIKDPKHLDAHKEQEDVQVV